MRDLPDLVSRYAESVLPDALAPSAKIRVTQTGEMVLKPGKRPLRFEAVEDFATTEVAFVWRARFPILGPISLRVTDSYQPPNGSLEVRLLGLPVQRHRGPELARGEALRYLAEIPWTPQAILANRELEWRELDDRWIGEYADYTSFDGIRMPARGEVRWELPDGPFTYWRGRVTSAHVYRP